jgi:exodeoxyribonuclease VII small subunit
VDNTPSDTSPADDSSPAGGAASAAALPADIASLSYEQARDELVSVVSELEQGASTLERSLSLWERGEALARGCVDWLLGARERLEAARRQAPTS